MTALRLTSMLFSCLMAFNIYLILAVFKPTTKHPQLHKRCDTSGCWSRTQRQSPMRGQSTQRRYISSLSSEDTKSAIMITSNSNMRLPTDNLETDYLGMIDFCLREKDNALSGPSRSKILNKLTNDIFKALIIGFKPSLDQALKNLRAYRIEIQMESAECAYANSIDNSTTPSITGPIIPKATKLYDISCNPMDKNDFISALQYIKILELLLVNGSIPDAPIKEETYERGYDRLITTLTDMGCRFPSTTSDPIASVSTIQPPSDKNICLSLMDLSKLTVRSKTKDLNALSNFVSRCILYGGSAEKNLIAATIDAYCKPYAKEWLKGDMNAQEIVYMKALSLLLREGISKAEAAVTYRGDDLVRSKMGVSSISGTIDQIENLNAPPLRLYDNYLTAFHRVVEVCLEEISTRVNTAYLDIPQNEDFLLNFVMWEQSLRRNLTADLWAQNPLELIGDWQFVDIKGSGSLDAIIISGSASSQAVKEGLKLKSNDLTVELRGDGKVMVKTKNVRTNVIGQEWFFKPGPAHLDTCEFCVTSENDPDLLLRYVGFIDRGQRIEGRFSRMPIRMTGRVLTTVKGEVVGSSRFIMALNRNASSP